MKTFKGCGANYIFILGYLDEARSEKLIFFGFEKGNEEPGLGGKFIRKECLHEENF